jgi:threonine/homoserine/homoserine lactone efflux protein
MEIGLGLKGIAVGFMLCAPLGPVGVLCLQRTITAGRQAGFCSILGAALVDGVYGLLAGFGMNVIGSILQQGKFWFQLFGGVVLVGVGIRLCTNWPPASHASGHVRSSVDAFLSTLTLMLSNPLPILVISAALSAITGAHLNIGHSDAALFALGLFLGSLLWSPILVCASSRLSTMVPPAHIPLFHRVSGAAIICCGILLGVVPLLVPSMESLWPAFLDLAF